MKNLKEKIANYYRTSTTDKYGQLSTISIYSVTESDEEREQLKELVNVCTYGGRLGTYKAFSPWGAFKCAELEQMCREAFALNEHRKRNLNSW